MDWWPFGRREIFGIIARLENRGHARMNVLKQFIGLAGNYRKRGLDLICFGIFPRLPYSGHAERLMSRKRDLVFGLFAVRHLLPFKNGIGRNNATTRLK